MAKESLQPQKDKLASDFQWELWIHIVCHRCRCLQSAGYSVVVHYAKRPPVLETPGPGVGLDGLGEHVQLQDSMSFCWSGRFKRHFNILAKGKKVVFVD